MSKIIVEVYLPVAQTEYDLLIPADMPFYKVTPLVAQIVTGVAEGFFISDDNSLLVDRDNGIAFDINMTAREMGLKNGSRIMLV